MSADRPVHAVEAKRLTDLTEKIAYLGYDLETMADFLVAKAHQTDNGENLSDHLYFTARFITRVREALGDIEDDMCHMGRPDIDISEILRWVKGPAS